MATLVASFEVVPFVAVEDWRTYAAGPAGAASADGDDWHVGNVAGAFAASVAASAAAGAVVGVRAAVEMLVAEPR